MITLYRVTGMDCPSCAAKIESAVGALPGVAQVRVSIATGTMSVSAAADTRPAVASAVRELGYEVACKDASAGKPVREGSKAYRRALWIVVVLNLAYGLIEAVAGFSGRSQALKADALDFIGDGAISCLGLVAASWGIAARAKAAFAQGLFLGALGLGVIFVTLYRLIAAAPPEAEVMGVFGTVALGINLLSAVVLVPHRKGDANARAIWLFSRNDALGNIAVVAAAALVAWLNQAWPDIVVAFVISALFLHSSWAILRHARADLAQAEGHSP